MKGKTEWQWPNLKKCKGMELSWSEVISISVTSEVKLFIDNESNQDVVVMETK